MIVVEHARIELDFCVRCRGVWFDHAELELFLHTLDRPAAGAAALRMKPHTGTTAEQPRKCPLCRKRMQKSTIGSNPEVLIDSCSRGHGLWFDGGELDQVLREATGDADAGGRVVSFLGRTLSGGSGGKDPK
jgi:Zn-finger nucleic acid-binding protein